MIRQVNQLMKLGRRLMARNPRVRPLLSRVRRAWRYRCELPAHRREQRLRQVFSKLSRQRLPVDHDRPARTESNLGTLVASWITQGDIARPAAIPGWSGIDYSTGKSSAGEFWLNGVKLGAKAFRDYRQTLNMHDGTLSTSYRYTTTARKAPIYGHHFHQPGIPHLLRHNCLLRRRHRHGAIGVLVLRSGPRISRVFRSAR